MNQIPVIKTEAYSYEQYGQTQINTNKTEETSTTSLINSRLENSQNTQNVGDVFKIAEKAEKLLQELLNAKKTHTHTNEQVFVKQEPQEPSHTQLSSSIAPIDIASILNTIRSKENEQQQQQQVSQAQFTYQYQYPSIQYVQYPMQQQYPQTPPLHLMSPAYYMTHPPPPPPPPMPLTQVNYQSIAHSYNQQYTRPAVPVVHQNMSTCLRRPSMGMCEDDDINVMRERELNALKCKSICEKMGIFVKYYLQFKETYIHRIRMIDCSESLKYQFNSLIKYLNEYEALLMELNQMIQTHEREYCKNNHRKLKKYFNKTKAFIRYDCQKRLQTNIFEFRRQINSQDRYAGMYDLLDMNNYLIGILPDIGVSIRRFINRCEKYHDEDEHEDEYEWNLSDEDTNDDGLDEGGIQNEGESEGTKENDEESTSVTYYSTSSSSKPRSFESFSKGVDSLNRYLLKRVEEEESLDELVKERIIKWINKRQSKYILIFADVDNLLNQHKDGECNQKFHSYLQFNLGKLVTVCDSYHQKLKELLYSTTIRRKKKRKKVKLLPESMGDVFDEVNELKRALEHTKMIIKKCNQIQ